MNNEENPIRTKMVVNRAIFPYLIIIFILLIIAIAFIQGNKFIKGQNEFNKELVSAISEGKRNDSIRAEKFESSLDVLRTRAGMSKDEFNQAIHERDSIKEIVNKIQGSLLKAQSNLSDYEAKIKQLSNDTQNLRRYIELYNSESENVIKLQAQVEEMSRNYQTLNDKYKQLLANYNELKFFNAVISCKIIGGFNNKGKQSNKASKLHEFKNQIVLLNSCENLSECILVEIRHEGQIANDLGIRFDNNFGNEFVLAFYEKQGTIGFQTGKYEVQLFYSNPILHNKIRFYEFQFELN